LVLRPTSRRVSPSISNSRRRISRRAFGRLCPRGCSGFCKPRIAGAELLGDHGKRFPRAT
jgi:hypothetical protein